MGLKYEPCFTQAEGARLQQDLAVQMDAAPQPRVVFQSVPLDPAVAARAAEVSSHTIHQLNGFRKSTPPQNCHFIVDYYQ